MQTSPQTGRVPHTLTVRQAAALVGMTPGGLRGAILRGRLSAHREADGRLVVRSHNLAAFHLYGDGRRYPEEKMGPTARVALHDYLETMCHG